MGIELPQPSNIFLPEVPSGLAENVVLYDYLQRLTKTLEASFRGYFDNDELTATTINSGISGTFTISSGGSIIVTSGIVINVTS